MNRAIFTRAVALCRAHPLRAYDAVQLACALTKRDDDRAQGFPALTFVCADASLLSVAAAEGFAVENPNAYFVACAAVRPGRQHLPAGCIAREEEIRMRHKGLARLLLGVAVSGLLAFGGAPTTLAYGARDTAAPCPAPPVSLAAAVYSAQPRGAAGHATVHDVALTFDDGPSPSSSPAILAVLERTHTPATFFVIGEHVASSPSLLRREQRDGFAIGVHTWDHPDLTRRSAAQVARELATTVQVIHQTLGADYCVRYFRPPYGAYNATVLRVARGDGLATILWDVDPVDWSRPGTQTIVARVLARVHPGAIILMHDGPAQREQTAAALPAILAGLRARGLVPVTLPRLLADAAAAAHGK